MPNFSFLDSLEVVQIYYPRGWGVGGWVSGVDVITRTKANLSSTELGLTSQLELSLAKRKVKNSENSGSLSLCQSTA